MKRADLIDLDLIEICFGLDKNLNFPYIHKDKKTLGGMFEIGVYLFCLVIVQELFRLYWR